MAAYGIVDIAGNHQELPVGSSDGRGWIIHLVGGKFFCETHVDKGNEHFFIPVDRDLLRRKGNEHSILFLSNLKRTSDGIGIVLRIGIGKQKPRAFSLLYG